MPQYVPRTRPHHASRRRRQRRAGLRLLVDHRPARAALRLLPRAESGAGPRRGRAERIRAVGEPRPRCRRCGGACSRSSSGSRPGIALGTLAVARVSPDWLKLWTFALLLPLILVQAGGFRRPIRAERASGLPVRRRRRRAVCAHDDLRAAAGGRCSTTRGWRSRSSAPRLDSSASRSRRSPPPPTGMRACSPIAGPGADPGHRPEPAHRRALRRLADPPCGRRDVPPRLHEFRRLDRRLRHLDAAPPAARRRRARPRTSCWRRSSRSTCCCSIASSRSGARRRWRYSGSVSHVEASMSLTLSTPQLSAVARCRAGSPAHARGGEHPHHPRGRRRVRASR